MASALEGVTSRSRYLPFLLSTSYLADRNIVFYFRQMPLISESKVIEILEVLSRCLDDEIVEVREMAAT